jgi:hypothetical protein
MTGMPTGAEPGCWKLWIDSLTALADDAEKQISDLPDGCCKADELALDFGHWSLWLTSNHAAHLNAQQRQSIDDINSLLDSMTQRHEAELWTESALRNRDEWKRVRTLAKECLAHFQ